MMRIICSGVLIMSSCMHEPAPAPALAPARDGARLQDRFWPAPDGAWHPRHRFDEAAPRFWPPDEYTADVTMELPFPMRSVTMD